MPHHAKVGFGISFVHAREEPANTSQAEQPPGGVHVPTAHEHPLCAPLGWSAAERVLP